MNKMKFVYLTAAIAAVLLLFASTAFAQSAPEFSIRVTKDTLAGYTGERTHSATEPTLRFDLNRTATITSAVVSVENLPQGVTLNPVTVCQFSARIRICNKKLSFSIAPTAPVGVYGMQVVVTPNVGIANRDPSLVMVIARHNNNRITVTPATIGIPVSTTRESVLQTINLYAPDNVVTTCRDSNSNQQICEVGSDTLSHNIYFENMPTNVTRDPIFNLCNISPTTKRCTKDVFFGATAPNTYGLKQVLVYAEPTHNINGVYSPVFTIDNIYVGQNFLVSMDNNVLNAVQAQSANTAVVNVSKLGSDNSLPQYIRLSCSMPNGASLPAGVSCSFSRPDCGSNIVGTSASSCTSTLTVRTATNTPRGRHILQVRALGPNYIVKNKGFSLTVN